VEGVDTVAEVEDRIAVHFGTEHFGGHFGYRSSVALAGEVVVHAKSDWDLGEVEVLSWHTGLHHKNEAIAAS
jgi:hypothetical protein